MIEWRIALRYLFSKKSHSAVNIISIISVAGVAVATAAIVIVLSVFNGFTDLAASLLSAIDPDLKIVPVSGKTIDNADSLSRAISQLPGVELAMPIVEERGLAISGNMQMPVVFMGVPDDFAKIVDIDKIIVDGDYQQNFYDMPAMQVGTGVAVQLGVRPSTANVVSLYVPRRVGRINPANPSAAFRGEDMMLTGVVQTNQSDYDTDHVIVPIETARALLDYGTEATAIEVDVAEGASVKDASRMIVSFLQEHAPADSVSASWAKVLTREMQAEKSFKMIMIEKWVTFLMLAFILVIASFNIISTLSLLVIEKRGNMETLRALGAPMRLINRIFMCEGVIVSLTGGLLGIALGSALTLVQQYGSVIKLSGDPSQLTIDTYPVHLLPSDILVVVGLIAIVAVATSLCTMLFTKTSRRV